MADGDDEASSFDDARRRRCRCRRCRRRGRRRRRRVNEERRVIHNQCDLIGLLLATFWFTREPK